MSSCLAGGRAAYKLDLEIIKSPSTSWISQSSSPSSTLSESSNSPIAISTRKPRTPRKRPNQTYNEAAALLSTVYPKIFSKKHLTKPCKFTKPHYPFSYDSSDLVVPYQIVENSGFLLHPPLIEKPDCVVIEHKSVSSCEKPCLSPGEIDSKGSGSIDVCEEFHEDFDAESILDEEIEEGVIDNIMGKIRDENELKNESIFSYSYSHSKRHQNNSGGTCYGFPIGLGFENGYQYYDFGTMRGGVRPLRNVDDGDNWWRYTSSVNVTDITPKFNKPPIEKKKKKVERPVEMRVGAETSSAKDNSITRKKNKENSNHSIKEEVIGVPKPKSGLLLKLNFDDVLNAWSDKESPFSDDIQGSDAAGNDVQARLAQIDLFSENGGIREASVLRYKEKRRTRLFSKKIRYQVRKVNAVQRDFGIYVCNMFDTGQASRILKLERNSLEHLLQHFCEVTANKEYQNADWRLRPLPAEMMKYAREDTHYLLYIYDVMRMKLLSLDAGDGSPESPDDPLVEVYKRSYDICMQMYEKELLTDTSYQHIYGLQGAGFNAQQLAVVAGLHGWRDVIARAEDESTGYVLPNKTLTEIAKQMPLTPSKLKGMMKSKHLYVERNLGSVVSIIRASVQNSAAYEAAAEQLKERRLELRAEETIVATEGAEMSLEITEPPGDTSDRHNEYGGLKGTSSGQVEVTIQAIKKPSRGLGMLLGSTAKRKMQPDKKEAEEIQVQQIKSLVSFPFHPFSGSIEQIQQAATVPAKPLEINHREEEPVAANCKTDVITVETDSDDGESVKGELSTGGQENSSAMPVVTSKSEDVILLETDSDCEESGKDDSEVTNNQPECGENKNVLSVEMDEGGENMPLSINKKSKGKLAEKPQAHEGELKVEGFDYEAARKQVVFGEDPGKQQAEREGDESRRSRNEKGNKKDLLLGQPPKIEEAADFQQGRRRQAFPASGNRSYTFR